MFICVFVCFIRATARDFKWCHRVICDLRCFQLECCGADGYKDWFSTSNMTSSYNVTKSCCEDQNDACKYTNLRNTNGTDDTSDIFTQVCVVYDVTTCSVLTVQYRCSNYQTRVFYVFVSNKTTVKIWSIYVLTIGVFGEVTHGKNTAVMCPLVKRLDAVH